MVLVKHGKVNLISYKTTMRFASIRSMDISNGEGLGVAVFTQGCPFHCFNCFNSETWDFKGGQEWTQHEEDVVIDLMKAPYIKRLSLLGGEPLLDRNIESLTKLVKRVKELYPEKKIWCYTGQLFEDVSRYYPELVKMFDVLIDGRYVDEERDYTLKWCGSRNQRVIDIEDTLLDGKIKLHATK